MRSLILQSALALTILVPASAFAQATPQKIAFVNTNLILQAAPGATEAQATFSREMEGFGKEVQALTDSLSKLEQAYQKDAPTLSPAARENRERSLLAKRDTFAERAKSLEQQAEQRQMELMEPIRENVVKALEDMRTEGGYSFIFDVANSSMIVAADKNLDITDRVIARLRTMTKPVAAPVAGPTTRPAGVQARPPRTTPPTR